ncbi:MAG: hypothetical protein US89_C0010G0005 [Candidatus Peregrinibacteria bacterium GW2011_GWF2_38_29]|nr:MAG: hypothetical protein US89_C0010G0005 [Candidatus Peregrinibacteria bacterium GW2011_GWF2_38_29]HBB02372.1 hypothetical protein [Candidatus Peregrinibacteria bacterium]
MEATSGAGLDENESGLLSNLAERYFKGTLTSGMRRSDTAALVRKMDVGIWGQVAAFDTKMKALGVSHAIYIGNEFSDASQEIARSFIASGELNFTSESLSDDDRMNIAHARVLLSNMAQDFHKNISGSHNHEEVDPEGEVTGAAQRRVAETGTSYFRDTDSVSFRGEVRKRLAKAAEWASITGRDIGANVYLHVLKSTHEVLGILGASSGIEEICGVLKGLYADRLKDGFAFVVQADVKGNRLSYNTYFRKSCIDSVEFGTPVKKGVSIADLDSEMMSLHKVDTEGTMAIAVPKISGDEDDAKVEFDLYIVESESADRCLSTWSGPNGC